MTPSPEAIEHLGNALIAAVESLRDSPLTAAERALYCSGKVSIPDIARQLGVSVDVLCETFSRKLHDMTGEIAIAQGPAKSIH